MATPATLKRMEQSKKKSMDRKLKNQASGFVPLSAALTPRLSVLVTPRAVEKSGTLDFTNDEPIVAATSTTRQYTSFESSPARMGLKKERSANQYGQSIIYHRNKPHGGGSVGVKSKTHKPAVREVQTLSDEIACDEYEIRSDKLICFHGKDHYLSSLYPSKLSVDGNEYGSVEQYYQACKLYELAGPEYAIQLRGVRSPMQAKSATKNILRELGVKEADIDAWKEKTGASMLYHATLHKFTQNKPLRQKLLSTENAILAQAYDRDTYFACGMKKDDLVKWAGENEGKTLKIPSELMNDIGNYTRYVPLTGRGKNMLGCIAMQVRSQLKGKTQSGVMTVLETHLSEMSIGKTNKSGVTAVSSNTNDGDTAVDGPGSAPDGTNGEKENKDEDAKKEESEKEE